MTRLRPPKERHYDVDARKRQDEIDMAGARLLNAERHRHRQTGRTMRQMQRAPQKALYIVGHHGMLEYARAMAHRIHRTDLQLITLDALGPAIYAGRELSGVVLDHHCVWQMNERDWRELWHAEARVR